MVAVESGWLADVRTDARGDRGRSHVYCVEVEEVSSLGRAQQPAQITDGWLPLLTFGTEAVAYINPQQTYEQAPQARPPSFPISGWIHGAARQLDEGRIVFLGEAAMCSAQVLN